MLNKIRTNIYLVSATVQSNIVDLALRIVGPSTRKEMVRLAGSAKRIIDLCAGTGSILLEYARENPGAEIVTVDRDPEILNLAMKRLSSHGYKRIDTIASEVDDIPVPPSSFDLVNITYGLHENDKERRALILKECKRILEDEGNLLVADYREVTGVFKSLMMRSYLKHVEPPWVYELFDGGLAREIEAAGFTIKTERTDFPMTQLIIARKP